ncbi:Meiotic nuclear division protein 1 [Tetrabaena socialis]|uniref:Meiotic nuclear division protein 1 homolog n=1 Tax=Tetrabaena socialis TaxID=47790 RepID=A0A2J8A160_9CHLO|nr:Meiotic nuclear division protein 1 [Tetrabaena socialis]|eukprot:PNH06256.1 Meiotic nuclear division protein 1 [Tetrabaena socialis]
MAPKKGVSAADKRDRMLEIFHDSSDVFVIKDIEKLSVKKGIISQAVKDVLQSLVDDDIVKCEKIGISNYYWSFPAEASVKLEAEVKKCETDLSGVKKRRLDAEAALAQHKAANPNTEDRAKSLAALNELKTKVAGVVRELEAYRDSDPETVEAMRNAADGAKLAANRWLDNTYSLLSWCKKKFAGRESELAKFFEQNGLDDNAEYIE